MCFIFISLLKLHKVFIMIKNLLKKYNYPLYEKLAFIRAITPSVWFINFLFQRVFRKGGNLDFSIHFTSTIDDTDLKFHYDKTTLKSFAASGHCYFQSYNGIKIGKNFLFGPGVKLISSNHDFKNKNIPQKTDPIIIGDDVWIGANAIILPGVVIGDNCIIGAGSVVTKSFTKSGSIIAGNPAKIIGSIDENL